MSLPTRAEYASIELIVKCLSDTNDKSSNMCDIIQVSKTMVTYTGIRSSALLAYKTVLKYPRISRARMKIYCHDKKYIILSDSEYTRTKEIARL